MTRLEQLYVNAKAASAVAHAAAANKIFTWDAADTAWDAYYRELDKTQEENSND